jgi:hypothetical protein
MWHFMFDFLLEPFISKMFLENIVHDHPGNWRRSFSLPVMPSQGLALVTRNFLCRKR